jgi:hypothetical protein
MALAVAFAVVFVFVFVFVETQNLASLRRRRAVSALTGTPYFVSARGNRLIALYYSLFIIHY